MLVWIAVYALHWYADAAQLVELHAGLGLRSAAMIDAWRGLGGEARGHGLLQDLRVGALPLLAHWFMHAGVIGVVFNSVFVWTFGGRLEHHAGAGRFALFLVLAAATGGIAHVLLAPRAPRPAIGAAAVTAAVIGAYLVRHFRSRVTVFVPVLFVPAFVVIAAPILGLGWLVVQYEPVQRLLGRGDAGPLGYAAIGVGLAFGSVLGLPLLRRRALGSRPAGRT